MNSGVELTTAVEDAESEADRPGQTPSDRLRIRSLSKWFGSHRAVADFSVDIDPGEIMCLLGPSGCGKTTTLRMVAGLEEPDDGYIAYGDEVFYENGEIVLPSHHRRLGMVFQSYALWPHMSVHGNVEYPLRRSNLLRTQRRKLVQGALDQVGLPSFGSRRIDELSGGQQQRVALARAIVAQPRVVLFDEPLSNLDTSLRVAMRRDIRRLMTASALSGIYVTHDQAEALAIADVICVMNEGEVQQRARPQELIRGPRNGFVARFLQVGTVVRTPVRPFGAAGPAATILLAGREVPVDLEGAAVTSVNDSPTRSVCIPSHAVRMASHGIPGTIAWADLTPTGSWELGVEVDADTPPLAVRVDSLESSVGAGSRCHVEIDQSVLLLDGD